MHSAIAHCPMSQLKIIHKSNKSQQSKPVIGLSNQSVSAATNYKPQVHKSTKNPTNFQREFNSKSKDIKWKILKCVLMQWKGNVYGTQLFLTNFSNLLLIFFGIFRYFKALWAYFVVFRLDILMVDHLYLDAIFMRIYDSL